MQGDIVAVYNASGAMIGAYAYDAWGNVKVTYGSNNYIVTDPRDVGTFNFVPSDKYGIFGIIGHTIFDVLPWYLYGNSPNVTITILDRILGRDI